jgi:hypothetical protein
MVLMKIVNIQSIEKLMKMNIKAVMIILFGKKFGVLLEQILQLLKNILW